jgi:hypothetical protein
MRSFYAALVVALVLPTGAAARSGTVAPPGNSGISQYLETIPTVGGGRPTNTVTPRGGGGAGGSGGAGRSAGAGPSGGAGGAGGAVSAATRRVLARQGSDGRAAAALAGATAPADAGAGVGSGSESGEGRGVGGSSPTAAVLDALTGSGGGLGPVLPIILVATGFGAAAVALRRHRGAT